MENYRVRCCKNAVAQNTTVVVSAKSSQEAAENVRGMLLKKTGNMGNIQAWVWKVGAFPVSEEEFYSASFL